MLYHPGIIEKRVKSNTFRDGWNSELSWVNPLIFSWIIRSREVIQFCKWWRPRWRETKSFDSIYCIKYINLLQCLEHMAQRVASMGRQKRHNLKTKTSKQEATILAGWDPRSSASPVHLLHWEGSTKQKHSNTDALQQFTKLCGWQIIFQT